jgi:ADP-ribose pyrophosphatase YjhB (NUDIX family)
LFRLLLHIEQRRDGRSVPGDPSEPGWQASMAALRELSEQTRARDVGLAVYLWSGVGPLDAAQAELLAAMRAALGPVPVEETGLWFADAPVRAWINSRIDPHPNARGHARLAERMHAALAAQGLLAP